MPLAVDSEMPSGVGAFSTNSATLTYSFNNVAGGLVVCGVAVGGTTTSGVTYASVSMGAADKGVTWNANGASCGIFHKLSAATGSQTVVATAGSLTNAIMSGCISFTGHDTITPIRANAVGVGGTNSGTASIAITGTVVGNIIVDCAGTGGGAGAGFTANNQTLSWKKNIDTASAGDNGAGQRAAGNGGSVTMQYTVDPDLWGIVAVEVAASSIIPINFATVITGLGSMSTNTLNFAGVLDFDPGSNEASLVITGQGGILSGSQVEAWIQADAYGGLSTAQDMTYASQSIQLTCGNIIPGVGFTIFGRCLDKIQGRYNVRWFWV